MFGLDISMETWTIIILALCFMLLLIGKYTLLDSMMKAIIMVLSLSTILAVGVAFYNNQSPMEWSQVLPTQNTEIIFLIAFMGWMPAPLDVSIWHSLWAIQKKKIIKTFNPKAALLDFNIGYIGTIILGIGFLMLGGLVMFGNGNTFSNNGGEFSLQLIEMYTQNLGEWTYAIIGAAALTTMLSTTLTTLDASPRALNKSIELLLDIPIKNGYTAWLIVLILGTISIFLFFLSEMGALIKIATLLSFLTAPFYALVNYILMCSKHTPKDCQPSKIMHVWSVIGILFLIGFNIWYLSIL
jgi:Mn2+/Fe2+ NRAMP family transporter